MITVYPVAYNKNLFGNIIGVFQSKEIANSVIRTLSNRLNLNPDDFKVLRSDINPTEYQLDVIKSYKIDDDGHLVRDEVETLTKSIDDYHWADTIQRMVIMDTYKKEIDKIDAKINSGTLSDEDKKYQEALRDKVIKERDTKLSVLGGY